MTTKQAMPGQGQFQWNRGGWFGSQVGCTAWMLVGSVVLMGKAPEVAAIWLGAFALVNALGCWLWWRRDRLRPYPAILGFLLAAGLAGASALGALHLLRPGLRVAYPGGAELYDEPRLIAGLVVLVAALMGLFVLQERSSRKQKRGPGEGH